MSALSLPAILGGPRAVPDGAAAPHRPPEPGLNRTPHQWPRFDRDDEEAALAVLRSADFSSMRECMALEADVRSWLGVPHAIAYCNATSAIYSALFALGVGPGHEVIVPSATYWATALPALHLGAVPVFAEIDPLTLGLDPADVERRITDRTRAVIVVHLCGIPARIAELRALCDARGLALIEDAAHAHGAESGGNAIGTYGDAAIFSFEATKLVPAGEGGVLVTRSRPLWERALCLGHYERLAIETTSFGTLAQTGLGFNFRMAPLSAAVARSQLRKLPRLRAAQREAMAPLADGLSELGFECYSSARHPGRVFHAFGVRFPGSRFRMSKTIFLAALASEGVPLGHTNYALLHEQPLFRDGLWCSLARRGPAWAGAPTSRDMPEDPLDAAYFRRFSEQRLPVTELLRDELFTLPVLHEPQRQLVAYYLDAIRKVLAHDHLLADRGTYI